MGDSLSDYYDSNLKILKQHHPAVWSLLQDNAVEPVGNVFQAPGGSPNLILMTDRGESIVLHNEDNPEKDTSLFTGKIPDSHQGLVAIMGMGLGYGIASILKEKPQIQRLAVFELEPGIFIQALRYMDLSDLFADPRLILRIGDQVPIGKVLAPAQNTLKLEDTRIFKHPTVFTTQLEDYTSLEAELYSHINMLNVEGTTTKILGRQFTINRFKHLSTIHHHRLIGQLRNSFLKKPAVLVAGGPSLNKNVHLLKDIQDKAVIFAADTVFPTLLHHGVSPHFISTIDPSNVTFEKLADVVSQGNRTSLICIPSANLKTAKILPAKQVFWAFTAKAVESWLNKMMGGKFETTGASTVAHLNMIAAHVMGCEPIVFIGQDLAYSSKTASHADGTVLQGVAPAKTAGQKSDDHMVMGVDGKMVRTDRAFLSMKNHFEDLIKSTTGTYINATEGGAHIEGTEVLPLAEVIDRYCRENIHSSRYLDDFCKKTAPPETQRLTEEFISLQNTIKTVNKKIKQADTTTNALKKELVRQKKRKRVIKSFQMLSPSQQKQIKKIDRFHAELDNTEKIWQILEEITLEGLKQSERQKIEIAALQNDPLKYTDWLIKNLERLLSINKVRKETCDLLNENLEMVLAFREKEAACIHKDDRLIELARLYVDSGNYNLARPVLKKLTQTMPDSGEIQFLDGCTALQFNEIQEAQVHFNKALDINPELAPRVKAFRQELGDEFLSFVNHFKKLDNRDASVKYTLRKGLLLCPFHQELKKELEKVWVRDLSQIKQWVDKGWYAEAEPLINEWHQIICTYGHMADSLPHGAVKEIHLYHGRLALSKKEYPRALESFRNALKYGPEDHGIYHLLIDTCFVSQAFADGIAFLNQAIDVDIQFAAYWEAIGDQLKQGGQHDDAVTAYEKCYNFLPENIGLIKKIGDCYMDGGLLEEARAAYQLFKQKLEKKNTPKGL